MKRVILCCAVFVLIASWCVVEAENIQSPGYTIESGVLDYQVDDRRAEGNYNLSSGLGAEIRKRFLENGYAVYTLQSEGENRPYLRATLDRSQLMFRDAETKDEAIEIVRVSAEASDPAHPLVTITQEGQFASSFGQVISPMTCDAGQSCSPIQPADWKKGNGFGFSTDQLTYRPFFTNVDENSKYAVLPVRSEQGRQTVPLYLRLKPGPEIADGLYRGTIIITVAGSF